MLKTQKMVAGNSDLAEKLAGLVEVIEVKAGETIIRQGASDNDMFFILSGSFSIVVNGKVVHASHNVAKNVLDWEYTTEILRSDLRTRLRDQLQASPPRSALSHEGSCSQGPGALHVQRIPSSASAFGGQHHV